MGVGWFPRVVSVTMLTVYEPREAEGCCAVSPSEPPEGSPPADTLMLDFQPPTLWEGRHWPKSLFGFPPQYISVVLPAQSTVLC